jgi:hypothetical protein
MSEAVVMEIIEKAMVDKKFRHQLFNNPKEALSGFDLTDAERKMLGDLNEGNFEKFAGGLGDRTTKGIWTPGG